MITKENIHKNHRKRLKEKFVKSGLKDFAEHEILELLLFFSIPQADTNPTAHALINKFASLKNVFNAPIDSLAQTKGIGEHSAVLLKLIPAIIKVYNDQVSKKIKAINNQYEAIDFVTSKFKGLANEEFMVVCLNASSEIIKESMIFTGDETKVDVQIRKVTDFILKHNASRIIIAHNHPAADSTPSDDDVALTHKLFNSCVLNDIDILDHIIYSPENCYSFAAKGLMEAIKRDVLDILHFDPTSLAYRRFSTSTKEYLIKSDF